MTETETDAPSAVPDPGLERLGPLITATRLRNVLRVNAAVSGLTGIAAAVAAAPIADLLGVATAPVRIVGGGLVLFAVGVGWAAGAGHRRLPTEARLIGAADVSWVVATVVVIAAGALNAADVGVASAVGLVVASFAVLELRGARAVTTQPAAAEARPPYEALSMSGSLDAPVAVAWRVVTDHDLYGRLAPNLGRVEITSGNGPDLARRCYDDRGRSWAEACTLWDDGRRFAVTVDTSDYPYPLSVMRGSWWVEPLDPNRSQIGMTFLFRPRPGLRGRLFAWVMHAAFPFALRRILHGWRKGGGGRHGGQLTRRRIGNWTSTTGSMARCGGGRGSATSSPTSPTRPAITATVEVGPYGTIALRAGPGPTAASTSGSGVSVSMPALSRAHGRLSASTRPWGSIAQAGYGSWRRANVRPRR